MTKETILKEFDEEFEKEVIKPVINATMPSNEQMITVRTLRNVGKDFILSSQKSTLLYVIDEVEKMRKADYKHNFGSYITKESENYNLAISDIISKLQSLIDNK